MEISLVQHLDEADIAVDVVAAAGVPVVANKLIVVVVGDSEGVVNYAIDVGHVVASLVGKVPAVAVDAPVFVVEAYAEALDVVWAAVAAAVVVVADMCVGYRPVYDLVDRTDFYQQTSLAGNFLVGPGVSVSENEVAGLFWLVLHC